jgi:hypothetical protein
MEDAMNQVALHCSQGSQSALRLASPFPTPGVILAELDSYAACVDANPQTWQTACQERKSVLNACAARHSGLVSSLKERCRAEIEQYDRCLKSNGNRPDTCTPQLERLWRCGEGPPQHACEPPCEDCVRAAAAKGS